MPNVPDAPLLAVDSLVLGEVVYACGRPTTALRDYDGWTRADLYFRRGPAQPDDRLMSFHEAGLESVGALVEHRFAFPAVRALVPVAALEALAGVGLAAAHDVPYADRRDVEVFVAFASSDPTRWSGTVEAAGGRVEHVNDRQDAVVAVLPDAAARALRSSPGVAFVELDLPELCAGTLR